MSTLTTTTRIETYTGLLFDFADPRPEQICVEDIAHALSCICRFGGHIKHPYTVGQHALLVRRLVIGHFDRPDLGYPALHHDSAEAYIGDVMKPMKIAMGEGIDDVFAKVEEAASAAVGNHFGIDPVLFSDPVVKAADTMALRMEASVLKVNDGRTFAQAYGVVPLTPIDGVADLRLPAEVEDEFLAAHQAELEELRPF